jgi:hypothetical protein
VTTPPANESFEVFPVDIGRYLNKKHYPDLDVKSQVDKLMEILKDFEPVRRDWLEPAETRGKDAIDQRCGPGAARTNGEK